MSSPTKWLAIVDLDISNDGSSSYNSCISRLLSGILLPGQVVSELGFPRPAPGALAATHPYQIITQRIRFHSNSQEIRESTGIGPGDIGDSWRGFGSDVRNTGKPGR